jgi:hypothetical protein
MITDSVCQDISNDLCPQQVVLDLKITDFWDVTQYSFVKTQQHFQETNCLHLQVERLKFYFTLKMQAAGLSEMLVCFYWTAYCSIFVLTAMKTSNRAEFHHSHAAQSSPHRTASVSTLQILHCVSCISVRFQTDNAKKLSTCHHL